MINVPYCSELIRLSNCENTDIHSRHRTIKKIALPLVDTVAWILPQILNSGTRSPGCDDGGEIVKVAASYSCFHHLIDGSRRSQSWMEIGQVPIVSKGPRRTKKCLDVGRGIFNVVLGACCRNNLGEGYLTGVRASSIFVIYKRVYPSRFSDGTLQNPAQNIEKWMICIVENIDNAAACCD